MSCFLKLFLASAILIMFSTSSVADADFSYTDISVKSADVNGDGRIETVRLAGEVDLNKYDLADYSSFEYEFLEFVNTRVFIEDYRGAILYSGAVPQGLFEKLVLADFNGDGASDIFFTFHDPTYPNIDHKIISFKDNLILDLFNGELGHNGIDTTKYIQFSAEDSYILKLKSPISNLDVVTSISKKSRDLYSDFYDLQGNILDKNLAFLTYPHLSEVSLVKSGPSSLIEFSKLKSRAGEDLLSIQTLYDWKDNRWIPMSITASPLNYDINVNLNGRYLFFDSEPIIKNGRTLVPMRAIFEALGADIEWDGAKRTVSAYRNGVSMEVKIDDSIAHINGLAVGLEVPPTIVDGRTMVPIRFISESLGAHVSWDGLNRDVIIKEQL